MTYPIVERQVQAQVDKIAFFGIRQAPGFSTLDGIFNTLVQQLDHGDNAGRQPPNVFSTGRMDDPRSAVL